MTRIDLQRKKYRDVLAEMSIMLVMQGDKATDTALEILKESQAKYPDLDKCLKMGLMAAKAYPTNPSPKGALKAVEKAMGMATEKTNELIKERELQRPSPFQTTIRTTSREMDFLIE